MNHLSMVSTGLTGLDDIIDSLRMGDNVVLQVTDIEEYINFVEPFVKSSLETGNRVVYMRFASHRPIIKNDEKIVTYHIDAHDGFESFTTQVHQIIASEGQNVFYVFDCLSELLYAWATDLMIGNFFMITCPYLFELNTIAYFAVYKNRNSFQTMAAIRETTQVLMNIYKRNKNTYVHPLKVWNRYTSTMFLPHLQEGKKFIPITSSCDAAALFCDGFQNYFENSERHLDHWDKIFMEAAHLNAAVKTGNSTPLETPKIIDKICRVVLSRDERLLALLKENFILDDLLAIKSRLIGSGLIGGKTVGMLLARKILLKDRETNWSDILEQHDSFYIGSDVFYTFLVQNGLWKQRMLQKKPENYFSKAEELKIKMLQGSFPENIKEQFLRMLEYFGQSPIIVRSSSLLEDGFGNSFAGKYESIFCVNQGSLEERYENFLEAVRTVFASTMKEDALSYRLKRGLTQKDEQMALLVQRVSGSYRKQYFFPDMAGVGYSYNTYVWDRNMNPKAGMLRVVVGLGTRAVERLEGDYARIIALDQPLLKPNAGLDDFKQFSQQKIDLIDITSNNIQSKTLQNLVNEKIEFNLAGVAERDYKTEKTIQRLGLREQKAWVITFDNLSATTSFPKVMQNMLKTLERVYNYPVDIEFSVNFKDEKNYQINLLQCRPLQVKGLSARVEIPKNIRPNKMLFHSRGNFMGGNIEKKIQRIIYVEPEGYSNLNQSNKYEVARTIGKLNRLAADKEKMSVMLIGPGRWGTTTPSLGVPVNFSAISNMTVISEVAYLSAGYAPEVSFGTHFFQDLVENDIFYVALFPEKQGVIYQTDLLKDFENLLPEFCPESASLQKVLKVYDLIDRDDLNIVSDTMAQEIACYF